MIKDMIDFENLLFIARRKNNFDRGCSWSNGSDTYLKEIKKEIDEVKDELKKERLCYLEDELGDILWDYLNIVLNLEKERGVEIQSVITRAYKKYNERVTGIEKGIPWSQIKKEQKEALKKEQEELYQKI